MGMGKGIEDGDRDGMVGMEIRMGWWGYEKGWMGMNGNGDGDGMVGIRMGTVVMVMGIGWWG